ncbi:MAG: STAS domain-containing protein [Terracidiphilus sp.]
MRYAINSVRVMPIPEILTPERERLFFLELEECTQSDRPCLVLDCSKAGGLGASVIYLLLRSLEEAMKRNGDARLAAVSSDGRAALEAAGASRLFRIFDSEAEAVGSFHRPTADAA